LVIESVHTGRPGQPSYHIDADFLQWTYSNRSISSISRFLGISRGAVHSALLAYGISEPQIIPFISQDTVSQGDNNTPQSEHNFILDPLLSVPVLQPELNSEPSSSLHQQITFFAGLMSVINDELDLVILQLRQQFTRAGITILHG
jgi:hypothetical protein